MGMLKTLMGRQAIWSPVLGSRGMVIGGNATSVMSNSGELVSEMTALTIPAVFMCCRVIGEDIAKIPLMMYERVETDYGPGWSEASKHPAFGMVTTTPNDEMTAFNAKQALAISAALWGNGYGHITRRRNQQPAAWTPLPPWRVKPDRGPDGAIRYIYNPGGEQKKIVIAARDMIHITGPTSDGLVGWMTAGLGAQAIGVALAAARFTGGFFSNGATLKGVVTIPETMGTDEFNDFAKRFREQYEGPENQQKTAIFDSGAKYEQIGASPKDAQMIDTLRYSLEEIARIFRCHPQKLYDRSRAQGWSTLEVLNLEHLTDSLMPWFCRIEQEMTRKLIEPADRTRYKICHVYDYLMVADLQSRSDFFTSGLSNGYLSVNEVRAFLNRNPVEGGDVYRYPMNMATGGDVDPENNAGDTEADDDIEAEDPEIDDEQRDDFRPATQDVFRHAMQRVIDREVNAASRKATDPEGLARWAADWYPRQREAILSELTPPARMLARLNGGSIDRAEEVARRYTSEHIQTSLHLLTKAPEQAADELHRWQTERAPQAADHLATEVHHATSS